jgi:hypothetical protein
MAAISPYRALTPDERAELIVRVIKANKATRALFVMRVLEKLRGFRAVTLQKWPADQLAREVVRLKAETPQDEFDLLLALYVELEPEIQIAFLDAAGVKHEKGAIDDELDPPYGDAAGVAAGVAAVRAAHGARGERYLQTLLFYNSELWPGIETLVTASEVPVSS